MKKKDLAYSLILKLILKSKYNVQKKTIKEAFEDEEIKVTDRTIDRYLNELEVKLLIQRNIDKTYCIHELSTLEEYEQYLYLLNISKTTSMAMDGVTSGISMKKHIIPDYSQSFKGAENLPIIFKSINKNKELLFTYHKQFSESKERKVKPELVKQYQNRWYLVAYDLNDNKKIKTFGLDRITDISEGKKLSIEIHEPIEEIFDNIVGIDKRPRLEEHKGLTDIVLKTTDIQANIFESMPLHKSQKIIRNEDKPTEVHFNLIVNYEFTQHLFMYMPYVEIIEPKWLRSYIKEQALEIAESHN